VFGEASEKRFSQWLRSVCSVNETEILNMGVLISDIGTHSLRKGVTSYLGTQPGGPSNIAIFLRAGWSLGAVQSRYIFEGEGGDQYVGRAATGMSISDADFTVLPPHFAQKHEILNTEEWEDILPGYSTFYPMTFRVAIPYLLASLVHHRQWLAETLPNNHPFFMTRLMRNKTILDTLVPLVLTGHNINKESGLSATGIPPHIVISERLRTVEKSITEFRQSYSENFNSLPEKLRDSLLSNFQVNGAVPITHNQVEVMMSNQQESIITAMRVEISSLLNITPLNNSSTDLPATNTANLVGTHGTSTFYTWTWGGRLHPVSQSWRFPR
jgi:hypothetical protein